MQVSGRVFLLILTNYVLYLAFIMENVKHISISDIADACGVSAMTVSRALRQSAKVRPATLARILSKAEELGYFKGSRLGRPELRDGEQPGRVRLILGGAGRNVSIFYSRLVNALQRRLIRHNCECVLYSNDSSYNGFLILLDALKRQASDATIIIGDFPEPQLKTLLMTFPGAILLDNPGVPEFDATFSSFNFDNRAGARAMLKHLIRQGRENIVLMSGIRGHFFSGELEQAYRTVLPEHGLEIDERRILHADFTAPGAARRMAEFLDTGVPFDAVFSNDEMALGIYRTLLSRHIAIPETVALAGCDNLPLGGMLYPALSTIDLDYEKLADTAVKFVLRTDDDFAPRRVQLVPRLLIRESTGNR